MNFYSVRNPHSLREMEEFMDMYSYLWLED